MAKRIFRSLLLTAILAVLLTAALVVPAVYGIYEERMGDELRLEADYIVQALNMGDDDMAYLQDIRSDNRITLIAPDGSVLFDSAADSAQMENHGQRPEVVQALDSGRGVSRRTSDTLSEMTFYYAHRTDAGNVLRIANTRSSMLGAFMKVMPLVAAMLLCVVLLSFLVARHAAGRIVRPINRLDLDEPRRNRTYDELSPLLSRMEQQRAQIAGQMQTLERERAELEAILENMREGMVLLDADGNVLTMNASAAGILSENGKDTSDAFAGGKLRELICSALAGESGSTTVERSGTLWQAFANPVIKGGSAQGAVVLLLDVTEKYAAENSRREFTANVSHELKTPLTSISGYAEIIRDGIARPQDVAGFAGRICDESARLLALVNDILELSRLDEGYVPGNRTETELSEMLREIFKSFQDMAEKKGLTLRLCGVPARVTGYPVLLREMLYNLIDNAVRYTPQGGTVTAETSCGDGIVRCTVSDTGVGIPKAHLSHVFERFYRVDKSHSRATGGTGLGLAIVRHAAQLHDARVQIESEENVGTTVRLLFPE